MGNINTLQDSTMAAGDEVSHADILARIPEVWSAEIERRAEAKRIFRNLIKVNTDLVGRPGSEIKMPKRGYIDFASYPVEDIADDLTAVVPNVELTYDTVTFTPTESAIATKITKQAIDEAMVSLVQDALDNMALGVSIKEDADIVTGITLPAASGLTYIEANKGADTFVTGDWDATQAAADQTNIIAEDVLDLSVIVEASEVTMESQGFEADALVIHPRQKASLLRSDDFIKAAYSPVGAASTSKAVIGTLFGLNVMSSSRVKTIDISDGSTGTVTGYQAILMDTSAAGGLAIKRPVLVETDYSPSTRMHEIYVTTMYEAKRLNDGAVILINTA